MLKLKEMIKRIVVLMVLVIIGITGEVSTSEAVSLRYTIGHPQVQQELVRLESMRNRSPIVIIGNTIQVHDLSDRDIREMFLSRIPVGQEIVVVSQKKNVINRLLNDFEDEPVTFRPIAFDGDAFEYINRRGKADVMDVYAMSFVKTSERNLFSMVGNSIHTEIIRELPREIERNVRRANNTAWNRINRNIKREIKRIFD